MARLHQLHSQSHQLHSQSRQWSSQSHQLHSQSRQWSSQSHSRSAIAVTLAIWQARQIREEEALWQEQREQRQRECATYESNRISSQSHRCLRFLVAVFFVMSLSFLSHRCLPFLTAIWGGLSLLCCFLRCSAGTRCPCTRTRVRWRPLPIYGRYQESVHVRSPYMAGTTSLCTCAPHIWQVPGVCACAHGGGARA